MKSVKNPVLQMFHSPDAFSYEIGIDEAGRGPMFGRLYVAGVVIPKDGSFDATGIKDSKKITSVKKRGELFAYIQSHALAYHIQFVEHETIDKINIRQAVLQAMKECVKQISATLKNKNRLLLIDGDDFPPYMEFDETTQTLQQVPHETVVGGDNKFVSIAAASILAKVARDNYILELCSRFPRLQIYGLHTNMGYGTKLHLDAIKTHGLTPWHRRTYGCCKETDVKEEELVHYSI
jgi:ribonuclease HII